MYVDIPNKLPCKYMWISPSLSSLVSLYGITFWRFCRSLSGNGNQKSSPEMFLKIYFKRFVS